MIEKQPPQGEGVDQALQRQLDRIREAPTPESLLDLARQLQALLRSRSPQGD